MFKYFFGFTETLPLQYIGPKQHVYALYSLSTLPDEYIISFNIDNG